MRCTIPRTATFTWSPAKYHSHPQPPPRGADDLFALPLLATGTASGALDASFSSGAKLELFAPFADDGLAPKGSVGVSARFNRLVWGAASDVRPRGVIAAGMENGELDLWDPAKIMRGASAAEALVNKMSNHQGPIGGLDFNPIKGNLLASGASKGEVFIWDLNNPVKPFAPPASRSLDDVTCVGWNRVVQSVLAASSVNGYTVVWDIRESNGQKGREVSALSYSGASMGYPGPGGPQYGGNWGAGRPSGVSSVAWHPENPTKLATACEDDASPVVVIWDLRNARAPERVLTGHEKGVLSLAWCSWDPELLASCGKDCRTICWNPSRGETVAELAPGSNWAFQTEWCPRDPDLLATASFDGRISVNSLQSTRDEPEVPSAGAGAQADANDIFGDQGILAMNNARATVSLKQAPKWLQRPASAVFGFGGKLATVSHKSIPQQPAQPGAPAPPPLLVSTVKIQQAVSEPAFVERAVRLQHASEGKTLDSMCMDRSRAAGTDDATAADWRLLHALFRADSRDELVTLLGFSKDDVKAKVEKQIAVFRAAQPAAMSRSVSDTGGVATTAVGATGGSGASDTGSVPREPLVTFAETPVEGLSSSSDGGEAAAASLVDGAPSDQSVSAVSDSTQVVESELTEPSLFGGEEGGVGQAAHHHQQAADFYASIRNGRPAALPDHVFDRVGGPAASSVGATIGSRASSVASESLRANTFKIYPADESKGDRLITRALVLGDFESAVSLCLSTDRFADALLLAVRGGPELLQRTQKAYFERQTASLPYLRLYQSIVLDDLVDVVQNADLAEWQEIFVVLCTFAKPDEFANLAEQLGQRLEFQYASTVGSPAAVEFRKNAVLCFLAAGRLERVVTIWIEQMQEDEARNATVADAKSRHSLHIDALQTLVEKVTVFQAAVQYVDADLAQPTASAEVAATGARTYKLAPLYDRYCEYAELLAAQGLVTAALRFVAMTPADYAGPATASQTRDRLEVATGTARRKPAAAAVPSRLAASQPASQSAYQSTYAPPAIQTGPYGATATSNGYNYSSPYGATTGYPQQQQQQAAYPGQPAYQPPAINNFMPPPPPPISSTPSNAGPPPPKGRDAGGWNDAPAIHQTRKGAGSAAGMRPAITSPFPGAVGVSGPPPTSPNAPQYGQLGPGQPVAPPPRAGMRTPAQVPPPPPRAGQSMAPQQGQPGPYGARPGSVGPYGRPGSVGPGARQQSAPQGFVPPPPGPYAPPQQNFGGPPQQQQPQQQGFGGPQGQYGLSQPPQTSAPYAAGPYAPPPNAGPYAPPPPPAGAPGPYGPGPMANGAPPQPAPPQAGPGGFVQPARAPGGGGSVPGTPPAPAPPPPKPEPPKSKYPPGDREHIPDNARPIFETLSRQLGVLKQSAPPGQKKMIDDTERRLNVLFDALNCETLPGQVVDDLLEITRAMDARRVQEALSLHVQLLTMANKPDTFTTFMPAVKFLISTIR